MSDKTFHFIGKLDLNHQGALVLGKAVGIPGLVQTGLYQPTGRFVAVKRYHLEKIKSQRNDGTYAYIDFNEVTKFIQHEVSSMQQLRHSNLLPCLASFVSDSEVLVVTPFMNLRSVRDILNETFCEGLPEIAIATILRDVLRALQHLHAQSIVHRSVRASHILLDSSGACCLSGLRYSTSLIEIGQGIQDRYDFPLPVSKTNRNWLSPEFLAQNLIGYNEKSDIYGLGVSACELANGLIPFSDMPGTRMLLEKLRGCHAQPIDCTNFRSCFSEDPHVSWDQIKDENPQLVQFSSKTKGDQPGDSGVGASVPSASNLFSPESVEERKKLREVYASRRFSDNFHRFVNECSHLDPTHRPSSGQLLQHPFFKQLKKSSQNLSLFMLLSEISAESSRPLKTAPETLYLKLSDFASSMDIDNPQEMSNVDWKFD